MRICPSCGEDNRTELIAAHRYRCSFCGNHWEDGINIPDPVYVRPISLNGPVSIKASRAQLVALKAAIDAVVSLGGSAVVGEYRVEQR